MDSFLGQTTSRKESPQILLDHRISYFLLTNMTNGTIVVNVLIKHKDGETQISPLNQELKVGENFESVRDIVIKDRQQIVVNTTGKMDYYFALLQSRD